MTLLLNHQHFGKPQKIKAKMAGFVFISMIWSCLTLMTWPWQSCVCFFFWCCRVRKYFGTEDGLLSDPQTRSTQALLWDLRQADMQRLPAAGAQRAQVRHPCTSLLLILPSPRVELLGFQGHSQSSKIISKAFMNSGVLNQGEYKPETENIL